MLASFPFAIWVYEAIACDESIRLSLSRISAVCQMYDREVKVRVPGSYVTHGGRISHISTGLVTRGCLTTNSSFMHESSAFYLPIIEV